MNLTLLTEQWMAVRVSEPFAGWKVIPRSGGPKRAGLCVVADRNIALFENGEAIARNMANAPTMDLMLRLIQVGLARFEPSTGEFCFDGLRYSPNQNWEQVFDVKTWKRAVELYQAAVDRRNEGALIGTK